MSSSFAFQMESGLNAAYSGDSVNLVSWTGGTDEEVAAMLDAAADGRIDLSDYWSVGDVRTIQVGSFTDGAGTVHAAQEIDIVITSFDEYMGCGNLLQFDFKDALATGVRYDASSNAYGTSEVKTVTLPALVEVLPTWLKDRLIEFGVLVASDGNGSITTVTGNKLALRSEVEIFPYAQSSKTGEGSQIDYYKTSANRIKKRGHSGSANSWWERSPNPGATTNACHVSGDGSAYINSVSSTSGLAPFGCLGGKPTKIYGAYWDGSSDPSWTRTDDAADFDDPNPYYSGMSGTPSSPFDDCYPWNGMEVVEDDEAGTLVSIPKFWYKWTRDGDSMKLQIADKPVDGFYVSPAHQDRGDGQGERDVVYVGRYHCSSSNYKSTTGVSPKANITRATARSSIAALGTTIWQWDYAILWTIQMLYLVEFAHWNSQVKIGYGCGNSSAAQSMGASDNMPYHTGTMQSSRTTYGVGCQYRNIEDLWGNVYEWCDGIYFSNADIYCIKNPASFSDSSGGTKVGTRLTSGGYTSKWTVPSASGFEYALYPSAVSGSNATYVCDYCNYNSSGVVLLTGGYYHQDLSQGLFYLGGGNTPSGLNIYIGSRLMKLP